MECLLYLFIDGYILLFQSNVPNKLDIKVSRKNVFEDSYRAVMSVKRSELLKTR